MFVLNVLFSALLLAFNPISLLSFLQKVLRSISDSQRKDTKSGFQFCMLCLPHTISIPKLFGCYIPIFFCLAVANELEGSQALHLCSVLYILVQTSFRKYE